MNSIQEELSLRQTWKIPDQMLKFGTENSVSFHREHWATLLVGGATSYFYNNHTYVEILFKYYLEFIPSLFLFFFREKLQNESNNSVCQT